MKRWASPMVLVALVACTSHAFAQTPPVQRAPPLVPELRQEALREAPPPDLRVAHRRFARAVESFAIAVRRVTTSAVGPTDRDLAYSIEAFARVLEAAPFAETVRARRAASAMRAALADASLAGPPGSLPARQALTDALFIGTDVLLDLAYGPYGESREVTLRARQLEDTLYGQENDYFPNDGHRFTVALRQSVFVMKAILAAHSEPPPPPPPRRYQRSW